MSTQSWLEKEKAMEILDRLEGCHKSVSTCGLMNEKKVSEFTEHFFKKSKDCKHGPIKKKRNYAIALQMSADETNFDSKKSKEIGTKQI